MQDGTEPRSHFFYRGTGVRSLSRNVMDRSTDKTDSNRNALHDDVAEEPAPIKFHEVISGDVTQDSADLYIDYVFKHYKSLSPRSSGHLDIIRNVFAQPNFHSHFEEIIESSTSHSQARSYINAVVDDILQYLIDKDIIMSAPVSPSQQELLNDIADQMIFKQRVCAYINKVIQKACRHFELEVKRSVFSAVAIGHNSLHSVYGEKTWSMENLIADSPALETVDVNNELPKSEKPPPIYDDLPRYLPKYRPHLTRGDYVPLPHLRHLPLYTKCPFPVCSSRHMSPTSWRTSKLGSSTYAVPTFYLSAPMTQVYSKLTKYYNSLK